MYRKVVYLMIDKEKIRKYAKQCGADLCGFASMDRFEDAPKQMDPRYIFPDAKTCIVLASEFPVAILGVLRKVHILQTILLWDMPELMRYMDLSF